MPLKLTLKPGERVILAGTVIKNGPTVAHLQIESQATLLRQKDILTEAEATSPCKRIYLIVQLMYIGGMTEDLSKLFWDLAREVLAAAPSTNVLISQVSTYIVDADFYSALKVAKKLITYEEELMDYATKPG